MLQTKAPPITRHDYQEMPEGPPCFQLIEGSLVMSPSPNLFHQDIAGRIYSIILCHLEKRAIGQVFISPLDVFLGDTNVYQPDVVFVSNTRRTILTEHGIEGAPDLIVEILSPATARYDRGLKRKIYAQNGVKELWLVDPEVKSIQVYQLTRNAKTPASTHDADSVFKTALLPGLRIKAAAIFKSPFAK